MIGSSNGRVAVVAATRRLMTTAVGRRQTFLVSSHLAAATCSSTAMNAIMISSSMTSTITRRLSSTSTSSAAASSSSDQQQQQVGDYNVTFHPVYVHHVSKTVLTHLQNSHTEWLTKNGLDRGLRLNTNGTFVLQFPTKRKGYDAGRIWTSYDAATKQHWLSVYRQKVLGRFLLKDASSTSSSSDNINPRTFSQIELSNRREIQNVVDQMVATLVQNETKTGDNRTPSTS